MKPSWILVLVLVTGCLVVGCNNDGKLPVRGTVTWNGEPIPDNHTGYVTFTPTDPAIGPDAGKISGGRFAFRSSPGEKRVEIFIDRPLGKQNNVMNAEMREPYIPRRYNEETELEVQVGNGDNDFSFALEARPGDKIAGK